MPNPMVKTVTGEPIDSEDQYVPLTRPRASARRRQGWWGLILFILLIVGVGATVAFNPFNLAFLRPYALYHYPILSQEATILKEKVRAFYKAVESRNFDTIQPFFARRVDYFDYKKVRPTPDIRASYLVTWKNIEEEKHDIDWASFQWENETDSTYKVSFKLDYGFKPKGKSMENRTDLPALIRFNHEYQIFYIHNK
jgi:hypothetical protein